MSGWCPLRKLGEFSDIAYGYTEKAAAEPIGPKFLRITDIQNDSVDWNSVPYCEIDDDEHARHRLIDGDIVFARTGATTGKSYMISRPPDSVCASYLIRLRLRSSEVLPRFVSYYFSTKAYWDAISTGISGSAQGGFNASKLGDLQIPVPSIPEQLRIVAILDEAFAGLATATANSEKNLKNARELFEHYLSSAFERKGSGWITKTLGEVCVVDRGSSPRPIKKYLTNAADGVNWVKIGDTKGVTKYIHATKEKITKKGAERSRHVKPGDFILTNSMSFGRPYIMAISGYVHDGWFVLRLPNEIDADFFYYLLTSNLVQQQFRTLAAGAIVLNISGDLVKKAVLPIPPIADQKRIAAEITSFAAEIERLQAIYNQKLEDIAEVKLSTLQKAFSGELTSPRIDARIHAVVPTVVPNRKASLIAVNGISSTDLHAGIIAIAYQKHQGHPKQNTFGHVKAEKIAHMVEARVGIELGRNPVKDAAGPNDYRHLKKVESRAGKAGFFSVKRLMGGGYTFVRKNKFDELVSKTRKCLGHYNDSVDAIVDEFLPMDTQQAEIFATVYAAWNNLLIEGQDVTDKAIVHEARDNWHPDKLKISPDRFFTAINWMMTKGIVPTGSGKKVLDRVIE